MRITNLKPTKYLFVLGLSLLGLWIVGVNSGESDRIPRQEMDTKVDKDIATTIIELKEISVEIAQLQEKRKTLKEKLRLLRELQNLQAEAKYFRQRLKAAEERVANIGIQ